jgi:hypothetical protein
LHAELQQCGIAPECHHLRGTSLPGKGRIEHEPSGFESS